MLKMLALKLFMVANLRSPFKSQDLIVNSPFQLLNISL